MIKVLLLESGFLTDKTNEASTADKPGERVESEALFIDQQVQNKTSLYTVQETARSI